MKTIEVYVRSVQVQARPPDGDHTFYADHPCQRKYNVIGALSVEDKAALEALVAAAKKRGIILRVYDVSTLKGKLRALMKGVRTAPTTIIDGQKTNGIPDTDELLVRP